MKERILRKKKLLMLSAIVLLSLVFIVPGPSAQVSYYNPFYNPLLGVSSFSYPPFLPFTSPLFAPAAFRYANTAAVPLIFPAPTLPAVPAATIGGVGLTALIPTVVVTLPVPLSQLITTPLSPLITYTPLSLIGLTYAPVPSTASPAPAPIILPTIP